MHQIAQTASPAANPPKYTPIKYLKFYLLATIFFTQSTTTNPTNTAAFEHTKVVILPL